MRGNRKAVLTAILADLGIATAKFIAFLMTRSSAMLSETIHSLVDAGNGSMLVLGLHRARRPPDQSHPFGYGKELYFWTLLVALFIFLVGGGVSLVEGIDHVRHPHPIDHLVWSYATLGISFLFEGYSLSVGLREFRESEGAAASWRSIHASKDPTTFTVIFEDSAALLGLTAAVLGTLADQFLHWHVADGIASIAIGAILMSVAFILVLESKALLVGEGGDARMLHQIRALTEQQHGVRRAGYPLTMYFGPRNVLLAMNVRFDESLNRDGIEQTIDAIETAVRLRFPQVRSIYLEAESIKASPRLSDPAYPGDEDLPPYLR